jgi:hypothetical protein
MIGPVSVAVRANDIALRELGEQCLDPEVTGHMAEDVPLLRRIAVIELHRALRKASSAVLAGQPANAIEHLDLRYVMSTKSVAAPLAPARRRGDRRRLETTLDDAVRVCVRGAHSMTIRADHIALCDLS